MTFTSFNLKKEFNILNFSLLTPFQYYFNTLQILNLKCRRHSSKLVNSIIDNRYTSTIG